MTMQWDTIIQGVITGAVASGVLGALALARDWYRNCTLREGILEGLSDTGAGSSMEGLTVYIRNHTAREFIVRHVYIGTGAVRFSLNLTDEMGTSRPVTVSKPLDEPSTEVGITSFRKKIAKGFALVKPYTYRVYLLPLDAASHLPADAADLHIHITVEYQDWTDRTILVTTRNKGWAKEAMKKTIRHLQGQITSGQINQVAARFKMPPTRQ